MRKRSASRPETTAATRQLLHEVRTPIGQIIGYSEMVEEAVSDLGHPDLAADLARIREAARQLLAYLEGLFLADGVVPEVGSGDASEDEAPRRALPEAADRGAILVVDDEAGFRDLLARRLTQAGYSVAEASRGREALHLLEAGGFDVVLLDVDMPGMSGLEVLDAIRQTRPVSDLPVVMATATAGREVVMDALGRGANDYVTKPFDFPVVLARVATQLALVRAAREVAALAGQLEMRNAFLRQTFGRYVSEDIVEELLGSPQGLEIRGETRSISVLFCDLTGFTTMAESLSPRNTVSVLNGFLGTMAETVQHHGGSVDEFLGDGLLALFGAPVEREDAAERAVAAALDMQRAIPGINEDHRRRGLPEISMSIGIATGEVIVGNIGSEGRVKYGAVGSPVNLAARIESHAASNEVLVDPATHTELAGILDVDSGREVALKGFAEPVRLHAVLGFRDDRGRPAPSTAS